MPPKPTVSNPMPAGVADGSSVSKHSLFIAGLHCDVFGLSDLAPSAGAVSCLWLHHPRLNKKEDMAETATMAISTWNQNRASSSRGLIALAFDQPNHGTRLAVPLRNEAWRHGNHTHAQDMFSTIMGMVSDTKLLMDVLESYIFGAGGGPGAAEEERRRHIDQHLVLGVSLGGHSAWQLMFAEPRVSAGVMVIGCPDYVALLSDRARLSKLGTYSAADNGESFLGSKDFPEPLVAACKKFDPKTFVFGTGEVSLPTSGAEQEGLRKTLDSRIRGKRFQVLSGGSDKLVPARLAEPFTKFLANASETWYRDGGLYVEDNIYSGVGHSFNKDMVADAVRFIVDTVSLADANKSPSAKI